MTTQGTVAIAAVKGTTQQVVGGAARGTRGREEAGCTVWLGATGRDALSR